MKKLLEFIKHKAGTSILEWIIIIIAVSLVATYAIPRINNAIIDKVDRSVQLIDDSDTAATE